MWFITHAYATSRIVKNPDPLLIIGSTIPDIAILGYSSFDATHTRGLEFKNYLEANCPEAVQLAHGFMLHGNTPTGLDYYSHLKFENGRGYAYSFSKQFENYMSRVKLPKLNTGLALSFEELVHSFIEISVELLVAEASPSSIALLEKSIRDADMDVVARNISRFFGKELQESKINEFYSIFSPKRLSTSEGISDAISSIFPINKKLFEGITQAAVMVAKPTYGHFLETSIKNMKAELERLSIL